MAATIYIQICVEVDLLVHSRIMKINRNRNTNYQILLIIDYFVLIININLFVYDTYNIIIRKNSNNYIIEHKSVCHLINSQT